jgi:hypothetical protein
LADIGVVVREGSRADVAEADIIVCATSAKEPVFDSALLSNSACVLACGSHEPDARELDTTLMSRGYVVVEDAATALRETGDVIRAVADGALRLEALVAAEVVTGGGSGRSAAVFTSVGMAWEDLAGRRGLSELEPVPPGAGRPRDRAAHPDRAELGQWEYGNRNGRRAQRAGDPPRPQRAPVAGRMASGSGGCSSRNRAAPGRRPPFGSEPVDLAQLGLGLGVPAAPRASHRRPAACVWSSPCSGRSP